MQSYEIYGIVLDSTIRLPLVQVSQNSLPQWQFLLALSPSISNSITNWTTQSHVDDGSPWLQVAKHRSSYLVRFVGLVDFEVKVPEREIIVYGMTNEYKDTVIHLLLDHIVPRVVAHEGMLMLHAGAVAVGQQAVGFLGPTGAGKSTLIASFCNRGYPLLSDDCLPLMLQDSDVIAYSGYPGLRLWDDSIANIAEKKMPIAQNVAHYNNKKRIDLTQSTTLFCEHPLPLGALFVLSSTNETDQDISVSPISSREAVITMVKSTFKLDASDKRGNQREFESYVQISQQVPIYQLNYSHRYDIFDAVEQLVLETLPNV